MASAENQQHPFPAAPPSPSAGVHEMRDYYAAQDASRPTPTQEPYLTPYLGLRARLSQIWINRWTVLLLLVLIRTLIAIASLDTNLDSARTQALSACTSVENVGSAMASMPHYMSQGVNELSADGIEKAINGLMQMLLLSITGVEELVVFVINLLTSTYVCLITLAVGGSLHVAVSVAEDVGDFLNSTVKDVGQGLGDIVSGFDTAMNGFLKGVDDVGSFLSGKHLTPPTIDLNDSIAKLDSLQLPAGYDQGLQKLNASIPTFAQVNNFTNNAIRLPFEEVKKILNESMGTYAMNRSLFPLTFCSDNQGINDFFDDLVHIEHLAKKIFLVVLLLAAILACIPMAYREIRRYRFMQERAKLIKSDSRDPMDSVYLVSRPYTSSAGVWLSEMFSSSRRKTLVRWSVAYATTYILLKAVEKEVPALTEEVGAFADKVVDSLNNASMQWAIGTNDIINSTNAKINHDVFGWVNTTTTAVNHTLNVFVDGMVDALNDTFGGTVLYEPILDVLNCLVLLKIEGIEKGLTWVSDHAYIDFPLLPNDTFSIGTAQKLATNGPNNALLATGPGDEAADKISDAVLHVTNALFKAVRQEAIISACVLLIWVMIALVGIFRSGILLWKGGDEGVYHPGQAPDAVGEKHEKDGLDGFFPAGESHEMRRVPTYEQATSPTYEEATREPGDHSANRYNGQAYTLAPRPFPTFGLQPATSPILSSGFHPDEKIGFAGAQNVESAIRRPTHIRASSYGNLAVSSPVDPPVPSSGRKSPHLQDPFADHAR
ncbi:plasma membrane fusion protein prm1 [Taxawa tesnikishii (nom. ined.)]|nr:plasma membrane fusion protein prm1 [Dothideales sp. JES 119]